MKRGTPSFTLVELITVMAIILLLVGLLLPALSATRNQARKHIARQDMSGLFNAMISYRQEYGCYPVTTSWTEFGTMLNGNYHPYTGAGAASGSWASNNNPKAIRFIEFKTNQVSAAGEFLDPWKTPYMILMDNGAGSVGKVGWTDASTFGAEDGMVSHPRTTTTNLQTSIAIYSSGSNKQDDLADQTYYDDVSSWNESP